jgi:hypothetical protein
MTRTTAEVVAALAAAGRLVPFDGTRSWADALFSTGPDGIPTLSPQGAPDRELLAALAQEYAALDVHLDDLPSRMRRLWLEAILGIGRLPALPDRVVAHATVDPKSAPAVVPKGTLLRGGKDAFGNERRYVTLDALTAHGAALTGVRALVPGGAGAGRPGIAASAPDFPLHLTAGPDATHAMRIHSPALAFEGGTLTAVLTFTGTTSVGGLAGAVWRCSRSDGTTSPTTGGIVSGASVTVTLAAECGAPAGQTPWIECVIPASVPVPVGLSFTGVTVRVGGRPPFVPPAAFYNDGAVDVTKEFQPFGAVAKRGDAFYLRCDEAFGKALDTLSISVTIMQEGGAPLSSSAGGSGIPDYLAARMQGQLNQMKLTLGNSYSAISAQWEAIYGTLSITSTPKVRWERRESGAWKTFGTTAARFTGTDASGFGAPVASETFAVAGQMGHYVRAFLAEGDFGWTGYQQDVAAFATAATDPEKTKRDMPTVPVPPVASGITVSYTTVPVAATGVESWSGWRHLVQQGAGAFAPFRLAVSDNGWGAMVSVGLELPDAARGSSVSVWFDVDSASPCGSAEPVEAAWQWWNGSSWQPLVVADGTHQLREPGLLRFVAPLDWAVGCSDVDAETGRWVRLVAQDDSRIGDVLAVVVDAVMAEFVSAAADPSLDPSSAQALPPGTIKGTLGPIAGVKKVTNLASVRGRGPETDADYVTRASTLTRHRGRAITPWDYEQHVALAFPEVAAVLCLPHTDRDGGRAPGTVGLVVVPDRPLDPAPRPSVSLVGRIVEAVTPARAVGARVVVLCADYVPVTVIATILLRPGVAALTGKEAIASALETYLHPTGTLPVRWGHTLYASTLVAFLERHPDVDVVEEFELHDEAGTAVEKVDVDPCRGLYCSSARHVLTCEEQL